MSEERKFAVVWLKALGVKIYSDTIGAGGGGYIGAAGGSISSVGIMTRTYQQIRFVNLSSPNEPEIMKTLNVNDLQVAEGHEVGVVSFIDSNNSSRIVGYVNRSTGKGRFVGNFGGLEKSRSGGFFVAIIGIVISVMLLGNSELRMFSIPATLLAVAGLIWWMIDRRDNKNIKIENQRTEETEKLAYKAVQFFISSKETVTVLQPDKTTKNEQTKNVGEGELFNIIKVVVIAAVLFGLVLSNAIAHRHNNIQYSLTR